MSAPETHDTTPPVTLYADVATMREAERFVEIMVGNGMTYGNGVLILPREAVAQHPSYDDSDDPGRGLP